MNEQVVTSSALPRLPATTPLLCACLAANPASCLSLHLSLQARLALALKLSHMCSWPGPLTCAAFAALPGHLLYSSINSTVHLVAMGGMYEDVVESVANITEVSGVVATGRVVCSTVLGRKAMSV